MNKCQSCGQLFEGKICPICGKQYVDEKIKTLSKMKSVKKAYSFLYYLSAISLLFFAILLFAFSALPIAITPSQKIMGEIIPSESYGNIFQFGFSAEFSETKSLSILFMIIAFITLIYSIVVADVRAINSMNNRIIGKNKLGDLLSYIGVIFYLPTFMIGCIFCDNIKNMDAGMGIISAGPYPILLIILSIIFAFISVSTLIINRKLVEKYPVLKNFNP